MDLNNVTDAELFELYWYFKDQEKKHKEKLEAAKKGYELVLQKLALLFPQDKVTSHTHKTGRFHYRTLTYVNLVNRDEFIEWVIANERYDMLPKSVLKNPVLEYLEQHQKPVPGVQAGSKINPVITKVASANNRTAKILGDLL